MQKVFGKFSEEIFLGNGNCENKKVFGKVPEKLELALRPCTAQPPPTQFARAPCARPPLGPRAPQPLRMAPLMSPYRLVTYRRVGAQVPADGDTPRDSSLR